MCLPPDVSLAEADNSIARFLGPTLRVQKPWNFFLDESEVHSPLSPSSSESIPETHKADCVQPQSAFLFSTAIHWSQLDRMHALTTRLKR